MSEFQYYEWMALDRRLDQEQLEAVESLSSHMDWVSPSGASVSYQWGDFKHDPLDVLVRYFDAFLYTANWGTRLLAFRFDQDQIDAEALAPYLLGDGVRLEKKVGGFILVFERIREGYVEVDDDGDDEEVEDEDMDYFGDADDAYDSEPDRHLGPLSQVRAQILDGDLRALSIAWLAVIDSGAVNRPTRLAEPPVPAGLGTLNGPLQGLVDFLGVRPELLREASRQSPSPDQAKPDWTARLKALPEARRQDYLERLAHNQPGLGAALQRELRELAGDRPLAAAPTRTAAQLLAAAAAARTRAAREAAAQAEAKRVAALKALEARGEQAWAAVTAAIALKSVSGNRDAIDQVRRLRELARWQGREFEFVQRVKALIDTHRSRHGLIRELKDLISA